MTFTRSLQAPAELRCIDCVRLTLEQINGFAAAIEKIDREAAITEFKSRHVLKGRG